MTPDLSGAGIYLSGGTVHCRAQGGFPRAREMRPHPVWDVCIAYPGGEIRWVYRWFKTWWGVSGALVVGAVLRGVIDLIISKRKYRFTST
jgi:hypothetical protein